MDKSLDSLFKKQFNPEIINSTKTAREEYDNIADGYREATRRELRQYTYEPSWKELLVDLHGKKVLDLACGEGSSTRLARELGADEVVGVDISEELIKKAVEEEKKIESEKRIKYIVGDVINLPIKDKYDVITGAMMINYCPTKEILEKMIFNAKERLNEGGIFYASIPNPERTEGKGSDKYGVTMTPESQAEGSPVRIELKDFDKKHKKPKKPYCEFTNYHWNKETYENVFKKAGFDIEWIPSKVSAESINKKNEGFWDEYNDIPVYMMIKATFKNQNN